MTTTTTTTTTREADSGADFEVKQNPPPPPPLLDLIIERRLAQLEELLWTIQEATLKEEWKSRVIALWMAHAEGRREDEGQMEGEEEDLRSEVEKRDSAGGKLKVNDGAAWPSSMHNLINLQSTSSASSSTASQRSSREGNRQQTMTFGQSLTQQQQQRTASSASQVCLRC
ncbi:hypothetical protein TYRP_000796 [Tyrophagus putrescentiae]|nr:hypothetical protein TYRP_000796 [Tyrophagus putrescentiae]